MIRAWQNADISDNLTHGGNLKSALSSITAKGFIMPTSTDLYFWADDNRDEAEILPNATFREIPSIWGPTGTPDVIHQIQFDTDFGKCRPFGVP